MKRILRSLIPAFFAFMLINHCGYAQVTASSINGSIKDSKGESIIGATIKATHEPSGTIYGNVTNENGRFVIPNARIGGPYSVEITSIGFQSQKFKGINLTLGEPYILNVTLNETETQLQEIEVTSDRTIDVDKVGASTNITSRQFTTLPTISRSITDFTRITPQANGNSFAGRDGRYNNIQVDGANLNNNFGLSNDPLPGGGSSPISLDAYEEISVNIAPFDVRQSGFTGAGINAVTKSGTNTFKGTVYTLFRNQSFQGTKVRSNDISDQIVDSKNNIYGFSIGGPIIKNKLFFFINTELEKGSRPGITFSPTGGSGTGNISSTPVDSLRKLSDFLRTTHNYETGAYDGFPNFVSENKKILVKIDYNLNDDHRLTFKYSHFVSTNDQPLNSSSVPNGGGFFVTGRTTSLARLPFNRFSNTSMSFANSNYGFEDNVKTGTLEFNSNLKGKASNQFLATITRINTTRLFNGPVFPTIDIFNGTTGDNYMTAGMDPYTYNNDVVNNIYTITDNFTYYLGKHTLTAGGAYEFQTVGNMFMAASNSYYVFNSLNDFITNQAPRYYAYTYSLVPGKKSVYSAELKVGQLGIYAQDEININNLKVTVGVRADKPIYTEEPIENPAVTALQFYDKNGNLTNYTTGSWPKSKLLLSPRIGVKWDVLNDKTLIVRGGLGVFTGRIPFVFLTNMPTNSGMYQFGGRINSGAQLSTIRFSSDPDAHASLFPTTAGTTAPGNIVFIDPNFKFPQVFRTNVAVDKNLGYGITATFEALITRDINAVKMRNANYKPNTTGTVIEGAGASRPRYINAADRNENASITSAIVLENINKGHSTALTFQLSKAFEKGLYGSLAYTFTQAKEVTANPGSQASSVWNANPNVGTSNAIELGNSQYAIPHRIIASVSYRREYLNHFASTLSLFFEGAHRGNYSFVVNGDLNGDNNSSTDLMYIPKNASEMNFEEYSGTLNGQPVTFTAADQQAAFETFINNSPYLKNHRGEIAGRNSALLPWYNRLDIRFLQDFFLFTGKNNTKHTLQFSVDILNFSNMISKNWGVQEVNVTNNPLVFRSISNVSGEDRPLYRLQNINGELVTKPFQDLISTNSTWSLQLGLRYNF
jgi:hypothetical protein